MIYLKKYIFAVFLILICLIVIIIPKEKNDLTYEYLEEKETVIIYYIDNEQVIGINMPKTSLNKFTLIEEVFEYLTSKANTTYYASYVNLSTKLISYEIRNDAIYLNLTNDFYRIDDSKVDLALAQILYTYKNLSYEKVFIKVEDFLVEQVGNCNISNGILDNLNINYEVVSKTMENKTIRIDYLLQNKNKLFINYLVDKDTDEVSFKVEKIIEFINHEYQTNLKLNSFDKTDFKITIMLDGDTKSFEVLNELLTKNLDFEIQLVEKS